MDDDKKLETVPCLNVKENADATTPVQHQLLYPERWWILASVSILQFANYGHWIAFGAVTKTTAVYYDQASFLCTSHFYTLSIKCNS